MTTAPLMMSPQVCICDAGYAPFYQTLWTNTGGGPSFPEFKEMLLKEGPGTLPRIYSKGTVSPNSFRKMSAV